VSRLNPEARRTQADATDIEQREPYRTALEVLDSPDPEAALAKLHPEWREAVRMLIGPALQPKKAQP